MYVSLREMLKNKESVYDGLHPSENGHIKISQLVANKLKILAKQNNKT